MNTYEEIQEAFIEAVGSAEKATGETVSQACQAVLAKATDQFGPGVYVKGRLDADMQGISFTYKRPSIRQRLQVFVSVPVDKPASQGVVDVAKQKDNAGADDDTGAGSSQDDAPVDRLMILEAAASELSDEDFTNDGRPHVEAINDVLEEGVEPFTAKERDGVWATRSGE